MMWGWDLWILIGEDCAVLCCSFTCFVVVERIGSILVDALEDGGDGLG